MKILHVMMEGKFTYEVVRFISKYFKTDTHSILYCNAKGNETLIREDYNIEQNEVFRDNAKYKSELIAVILKISPDFILLHNLFFLSVFEKIFLLSNRRLLDKVVWIEWGADLYSWKKIGAGEHQIKHLVRNKLDYSIRKSFKYVVCIFPPDIETYKKQFPKSKARLYYAPYIGYPLPKEYSNYTNFSRLKEDVDKGNTIYIQIGHNAMQLLNHKKVLLSLSKYKDQNIHIVLPLSYGNTEDYVEDISDLANTIFPGKVTILKEFISEHEYYNLLGKVSIAVFDVYRQCALANIHLHNFRNTKVFLSEHGVMYDYFKEQGVPVSKCEDIDKMSFEEFISPPIVSDKIAFDSYIYSISHIENGYEKWSNIYNDLKKISNE